MNKHGSALIIALALMMFITALGTLVLQTAQTVHALSIERALHRPPQMLLESLVVYACRTQGVAWYRLCKKTGGAQPQAIYTTHINGTVCTLRVGVEKGMVILHASCPGARGIIHECTTVLPQYYQKQAEAEDAIALEAETKKTAASHA
jgi:hypothetical protein